MVSSKKIKNILSEIIIADNIWMTDPKYRQISSEDLKKIVDKINAKDSPYIRNVHECEEFALSFLSELRNLELKKFLSGDKRFSLNCPVGICAGVKFDGKIQNHTKIISICTDGCFLIEPQSNVFKKFDKRKDEIFFIYM